MSQPPPRDEPMLSAGLAAHLQRTPPDGACPDAETLATHAEGASVGDEQTRIEAHLASCLRCQAHMIALVESAPPEVSIAAPGAVSGFGFPWKWLVPITSVALIVLAVWVGRTPPPAPSQTRFTPPPPEAVEAPRTAPDAGTPAAPPPAPAPPPASAAPLEDRAPRVARERAARPAPPPRAEDARQAEVDTLAKAVPAAPKTTAEPMEKAEARAQAAATTSNRMAGSAPAAPAPMASLAVAAPWRLVDGAVERLADGTRFEPEGVVIRAVAGVSSTIGWAVGDEGAVYRTVDGVEWTRIAFPERLTLVSVRGADASRAEVTAATGSRFATDDGGKTWRPVPPQ